MSRGLKVVILAVGAVLALIVAAAVSLRWFLDVNAFKPRLEAALSETMGMKVEVEGALGISLGPGLLLTLEDVYVRNRGTDLLSVRQARVGVGIVSLLRNELHIKKIALSDTVLSIEHDGDGRFNFAGIGDTGQPMPAFDLAKISVSDGTLVYADRISGAGFEARQCSLDIGRLRHPGDLRLELRNKLSVTAEVACREVRGDDFVAFDIRFPVEGTDGVFDLEPVTLRIFGSAGSGSIKADFSGDAPVYAVNFSLPQFRIEDFFKTLSPGKVADGRVDFAADLTMRGGTLLEMRQTAAGRFSVHGKNLNVIGRDLDREFADFESSQNFNLADVGAFFFAGPLGLAVTKGYNFASMFKASGGSSEIDVLVSKWKVEAGVAQAQDVALATKRNRLALHGGLNFVNHQFDDVVIALVDHQGCVLVRQKIRGAFQQPVIEQPDFLTSLAGPVVRLFKAGANLLSSGECDVFYAGSVAAPR